MSWGSWGEEVLGLGAQRKGPSHCCSLEVIKLELSSMTKEKDKRMKGGACQAEGTAWIKVWRWETAQ